MTVRVDGTTLRLPNNRSSHNFGVFLLNAQCDAKMIDAIQGGAKKWNIHALRRYLLNTGFVFVDHCSRGY